MEAGVFALSRLRIRQQMRAGSGSAKVLHEYLEHPENFLWTILVGNTVANFLILGWLLAGAARRAGRPSGLVRRSLCGSRSSCFTPFSICCPRCCSVLYPNRLCILLARPFGLAHLLLRPLVGLVEWFSGLLLRWRGGKAFTGHLFGNREELRLVMQESAQAFTSEERTMINRVMDLQSLTVRQIMTPLAQV